MRTGMSKFLPKQVFEFESLFGGPPETGGPFWVASFEAKFIPDS